LVLGFCFVDYGLCDLGVCELITTITKALAVQQRRVAAGKLGYAKAVRRFVCRDVSLGCEEYYRVRNSLPVRWHVLRRAA
jgi:hypothetical protein